MAKNYLPFAKRALVTVPINGGRVATNISDLSVGGGIHALLGDISIGYDFADFAAGRTATYDPLLHCRIGILGRGYLTESFYLVNLYRDGFYPESGVWHFPKPYRLFPGQGLRALTRLPLNVGFPFPVATNGQIPAIAFNGRRVLDNEPVMLYDQGLNPAVVGNSYVLNRETLKCPADSAVDLYSVVGPQGFNRYLQPIVQGTEFETMVWGPDDRQWWDQIAWPQVINPPMNLIDLNKPEWVLEPTEGITVEFVNYSGAVATVYVTLRGSLEVEI